MSIDLIPGFGAFTPAASGGSLLLDSIATAPAAAYSTRKLRSAYAGSAIRVRRSSDSAEQDIGFSGNNLDTASLASFIGANSGLIFKWYDQSGNANDLEQFSTSLQPELVASGTNNTINSIPAIKWSGAQAMAHPSLSTAGGSMSGLVVATKAGSGERAFFGGAGGAFEFRIDSADTLTNLRQQQAALFTTTATVSAGPFCLITVSTTSSQIIGINGSEESNTTSPSFSASNSTVGNPQNSNSGEPYNGNIGEVVLWQAALTGGERTTLLANVRAYWGTP